MEIYDLKDKLEYLDEVVKLKYDEWANNKEENKQNRLKEKIVSCFQINHFVS